jgi:hypothetical protein
MRTFVGGKTIFVMRVSFSQRRDFGVGKTLVVLQAIQLHQMRQFVRQTPCVCLVFQFRVTIMMMINIRRVLCVGYRGGGRDAGGNTQR